MTNETAELKALKAYTKDPLVRMMIDSHLKQIQNKLEAVEKLTLEARRIQTVATFVNSMLSLFYETWNLCIAVVMVAAWTTLQVLQMGGADKLDLLRALDLANMVLVTLPNKNCTAGYLWANQPGFWAMHLHQPLQARNWCSRDSPPYWLSWNLQISAWVELEWTGSIWWADSPPW